MLTSLEILSLYEDIRQQINFVFDSAVLRPKLVKAKEVISTIQANQNEKKYTPANPQLSLRKNYSVKNLKEWKSHNIWETDKLCFIRPVTSISNTLIFGEDVAKKGGVYHITADLYKQFGERRVFNSPLDETSIIGFGLGFAHNGFIPIPEIQFLAYLHNAEDQLRGEAATLPFFQMGSLQIQW